MSFTALGYDSETIRQQEADNDKLFEFKMDIPRIDPCDYNQTGFLPATGVVQNMDLESQMLGLTRKLTKQRQENEWTDSSPATKRPLNCAFAFNDIKDRSRFSANNLVSDINIRRFERVPFDHTKLAGIRRPSIGMDTRQFTKEKWRSEQAKKQTFK